MFHPYAGTLLGKQQLGEEFFWEHAAGDVTLDLALPLASTVRSCHGRCFQTIPVLVLLRRKVRLALALGHTWAMSGRRRFFWARVRSAVQGAKSETLTGTSTLLDSSHFEFAACRRRARPAPQPGLCGSSPSRLLTASTTNLDRPCQ
ncbi:unnamed protein product [Symbiodinium natans]|uniref:Uncharacterized protein n=1 Tax=Symbiodinium natans TaxID=878477 RepID=A0A812IHS3_9DINO|nr:unnamed protein product [Symbiodinium natans]